MIKENLKIKNTLKKLYENQEFESSFEDAVTGWNDNETINEEYVFRYFWWMDGSCLWWFYQQYRICNRITNRIYSVSYFLCIC
jgi:hypothetical protein